MSEGEKPAGMGAGKIVLIVVGVLVLLGLLCCGGAWFLGGRYAWQFGRATVAMTSDVQEVCGKGATVNFFPDDEGRWLLAVGTRAEITPARATEIQDAVWRSYAKSFADGGFELYGVAVGKPGAGKGGLTGWKERIVTVEELVARTGVAAPPKAEWIAKIEAEQRAAAEKAAADAEKAGEKSGEKESEEDAPEAPGGDGGK